jgi:ketosteroid isomerase-like protein
MNTRKVSAVCLAILVAACAGDTEEAAEAPAMPEMSADEMALEQLREDWVTHYNMGHASVVGGNYADDALSLGANQSNFAGRDAIVADMAATMEAASPQVELSHHETMTFGDRAVGWGTYATEATTPDGSVASSGTYMTAFTKVEGDWKIQVVITNFDAAPPEGFAYGEAGEPPENEGTMGDLIGAYQTHYNLGHPSMVADFYADDAMASFANLPPTEGGEAISTLMVERMAANPADVTINDVGTIDLGDGWALDGGWYQMNAKDGGDALQVGTYMLLVNQTSDGWRIKWGVTNGGPAPAM